MVDGSGAAAWLTGAAVFPLYAEIHYRVRGLPSRLWRPAPEVIADVPARVEPGWEGNRLPLLILVKDADRFPVTVERVGVWIARADRRGTIRRERIELGWPCRRPVEHRILPVRLEEAAGAGRVEVAVEIGLRHDGGRWRGRRDVVRGDGYGGGPTLLSTWAAADPYPTAPGWAHGDLHHHSIYTRDHIEFGAPVEATAVFAGAAGCGWAAITDHSYDLDDREGDYLANDPDLPRWKGLRRDAERVNRSGCGAWILVGEEVSCGGSGDHNLHLLLLGSSRFVPGTGDGAERWFANEPTLPLPEVLRRAQRLGGVAYAAHPFERLGALNRFAFRRRSWDDEDVLRPGLSGLQIWNGLRAIDLDRSLDRWVGLLDRGARLPIGAGNDAHGNFALARVVSIPFLSVRRDRRQIYGRARTALGIGVSGGARSDAVFLDPLARGRSIVTNGPFLELRGFGDGSEAEVRYPFGPGSVVEAGRLAEVEVRANSTAEFGPLQRLRILVGHVGRGEREVARLELPAGPGGPWSARLRHRPQLRPEPGWIRAVAETARADDAVEEEGLALTNPLWVDPPSRDQPNFAAG